MSKSFAYRNDPGTGQKVGTYQLDDPVTGDTIKTEVAAQYGHQAVFLPVTIPAGVSSIADYPSDGSGTAQAGAAGTITLASGVDTTFDASGLLVLLTNDTPSGVLGQVRQIASYVTSTRVATLNRNWTTTPSSSTTYVLLIDLIRFSALMVKSEFGNATPGDCRIIPVLFDFPQTGAGAAVLSRRFPAFEQSLTATGYTTSLSGTSMNQHGQLHAVDSRGALGAKIRVSKAPDTGAVALWACGI